MKLRTKLVTTLSGTMLAALIVIGAIIYFSLADTIGSARRDLMHVQAESVAALLDGIMAREALDLHVAGMHGLRAERTSAGAQRVPLPVTDDPLLDAAYLIYGRDSGPNCSALGEAAWRDACRAGGSGGLRYQGDELLMMVPVDAGHWTVARIVPAVLRARVRAAMHVEHAVLAVCHAGRLLFAAQQAASFDPARLAALALAPGPLRLGHHFAFGARVGALDWQVWLAVPEMAYNRDLAALKDRLIAALLVLGWVAVWVVLIIAYRLSSPLTALARSSGEIVSLDSPDIPQPSGKYDEVGELARSLQSLRQGVRELITRDPLTGTYNRRYLMHALERAVARAQRLSESLCCVMLDIDHFKAINDTRGHQVGDLVLQRLGALLRATTRKYDTVARYGGEEFVVVLPGLATRGAAHSAERIRRLVEQEHVASPGGPVSFTVSLGVASLEEVGEPDPHRLLELADKAMYHAKQGGRNRTSVWAADASRAAVPELTQVDS